MRLLPAFAGLAAASLLGAVSATAQTAAPAPAQTPAAAPAPAPAAPPKAMATAALKTAEGADAGLVTAYQGPKGLILRVTGQGWPAGWHGVHLHAVGSCEAPAFTSAGGHVNHAEGARPHGLLNTDGGPTWAICRTSMRRRTVRPMPTSIWPGRVWTRPRPTMSTLTACPSWSTPILTTM